MEQLNWEMEKHLDHRANMAVEQDWIDGMTVDGYWWSDEISELKGSFLCKYDKGIIVLE